MSYNKVVKTSEKGILLIKNFEGLRLEAYQCSGSVWTIGWGTTLINGFKVTRGDVIDVVMAERLFKNDVEKCEEIVNSKIKIPLNQNQFDKLVSHTYNTGGSETLFNLINLNYPKIKIQNWIVNTYITSGGKIIQGLLNRRRKEAELYFDKVI